MNLGSVTVIIVGIVMTLIACQLFYTGVHNVDLGWNMVSMEYEFDTTLTDTGSNYRIFTPTDLIVIGNHQIRNGFLMIALSMIVIMFGVIIDYETRK